MFEQAFKNIDDVLRKEAGCTTELDYTEQTSWLLFLKYLDGLEQDLADESALDRKKYSYILDAAYRGGGRGLQFPTGSGKKIATNVRDSSSEQSRLLSVCRRGRVVNHKRVRRIMREDNLLSTMPREN